MLSSSLLVFFLNRLPMKYWWTEKTEWHAVASWTWDAHDETCGICRMAFDGCCPDCKLPGDDCPLSKSLVLFLCAFILELNVLEYFIVSC
ncbi:anaphase-promoting complex subunit 11 [Artemisia annua]|uniref:Anaphase-promoting complex subunit 11 n=1 Tax=Artemisia annua TaxID=35608 RepID=A0A2U1MRF3_ARTAN|nr:anaphase-promoting complex subunit 11 [Artemisia annua]